MSASILTKIAGVSDGGKLRWQSSGCYSVPNVCSRDDRNKKKKEQQHPDKKKRDISETGMPIIQNQFKLPEI